MPQKPSRQIVKKTPEPKQSGRKFQSWWLRDLTKSSLSLLGITLVAVVINALLWFSARLILPQLTDLLASRSLSGAIKSCIALLGQPLDMILLGLAVLVANLILIEWAATSLSKRTFAATQLANRPMNLSRISSLVLTAMLALATLLGIVVIGGGLAYGASRWYFGAVPPLLLLTFIVFCIFLSWFMFLPFVIVKNGTTGARALSESRIRARQVRGRLIILIVAVSAAVVTLALELNGLPPLVRFCLGLLIVPVGLSLLSTLYAESETNKTV